MSQFTEATVEVAALSYLTALGYDHLHGSALAPDNPGADRTDFGEVILATRLGAKLAEINAQFPREALDEALRKVLYSDSPSLVENNRRFHRMLVEGVDVEYRRADGSVAGDKAWLIDWTNPDRNEFLAINQLTIVENHHNRRPDVLVYVNGLPLVVIELKNAASETATCKNAFHQIQTYKHDLKNLFAYNAFCVVSDGLEARAGTLTSDWERFAPWRTIEGKALAPKGTPELETLIKGMFERRRFLDLLRHFIVFEDDGQNVQKKLAAYHQYHAVNKAVDCTVRASRPEGDKRVGVVWHTQGSGKSLSMVFYAGKVIQRPEMANPTLVVLTDRNDLDDQLFGTFASCRSLLRQSPQQAESRDHLRQLLKVASGGVIFTTIQKFLPAEKGEKYPELSDRRNVVVIADEAHRSQYDFVDGLARNMRLALPNASFIGFTGTPVESTDRSTPAVFGDYIDVYDIQRAVEDGATVRIYYEGRLAKLALKEEERPKLDPALEELTEGEETNKKEKLKTKWAALEALVGTDKRIKQVAADLVQHFEARTAALEGKGMIVCMSRRICVQLYDEIKKLRPEWHDADPEKGAIKVVMTGAADDPPEFQPHVYPKAVRDRLAKRFKNPADGLKLVIVRDMWLTGFDAPCAHTMYVDKPMRGHGLMQAIARVNRVFKDKPGGLVVDYLGLADSLKKALKDYTDSGGEGKPTFDQEAAVQVFIEKYEVVRGILHGFDYSKWATGGAAAKLALIPATQEFILKLENGVKRYLRAVSELSKAFALAVPDDRALNKRDDVGFFQAVRAALSKTTIEGQKAAEELDSAVRQLISQAVASDGVIDLFKAAGLKNPDISILSDEFLAEVRALPHRNLALELLKKLINGEIKHRMKKNVVQARSFADMLDRSIKQYQNRAIESAQVIEQLIEMARDMREADQRGEQLGLSTEEVAFYDAMGVNDSAVQVLGDENLKFIAKELVDTVKKNVSIDWTVKESVRANLRRLVKRILRKYGYPPDLQAKATETVLEQAEVLCADVSS